MVARGIAMLFLLVGLALSACRPREDLVKIPPLTARVTDLTNTLSAAERQALDAKLAAWEAQTGNQLVVLMLPSTQPEAIAAYSIRVAEAWKIGHKGKDNGAVFLDRQERPQESYRSGLRPRRRADRRHDAAHPGRDRRAVSFATTSSRRASTRASTRSSPWSTRASRLADSPAAQAPQRRSGGGIPFDMILILLFVVVPVIGGILRRIFGRAIGSTVGAGIVGAAAWMFAGSLVIAIIAAIVAFIVMLTFGMGSGLVGRGGGVFIPGGGGGFGSGGGSGGGGFSGGGGGFGGGGASGDW